MKLFVLSLALSGTLCAAAQTKKPVAAKKPVAKPAVSVALKTLIDSASYAVGVSVANFYKQQGISNLNSAIVAKAINDVGQNKTTLLSDADANEVMMRCIN